MTFEEKLLEFLKENLHENTHYVFLSTIQKEKKQQVFGILHGEYNELAAMVANSLKEKDWRAVFLDGFGRYCNKQEGGEL